MLQGLDFSGLGAEKKPKEVPTVAPPLPSPKTPVARSSFPKWLPAAVGAGGLAVVIILLITGKDGRERK